MYSLFIYIKQFLNALSKNFIITIVYYLGFPIIVGLGLGTFMSGNFDNPINIKLTPVSIVDQDSSNLSKELINSLLSMDNVIYLTDEETKPHIEITIPKDYEKNMLNNKTTNIKLRELEENSFAMNAIKTCLEGINEIITLNLSAKGNEDIIKTFNEKSINTTITGKSISLNSKEYFAIYMSGFFAVMMIMGIMTSNYKSEELGLNKRLFSMPLSRTRIFNYDFICKFLYAFFITLIYVVFFRVIKITFLGNIGTLLLIVTSTSFFIASLSAFMCSFIPKKYGTIIINLFLIVQVVFGGAFIPNEILKRFSPTLLITKQFENFVLFNNFNSIYPYFLTCILISLVIYIITLFKEKLYWRESI